MTTTKSRVGIQKFFSSIPNTTFRWDINTEIERIVYTSIRSGNRFYASKGFYVSPQLVKGEVACVHLPDLGYKSVDNYWDLVMKTPDDMPTRVHPMIYEFIASQINSFLQIDNDKLIALSKKWRQKEKRFWTTLYQIVPEFIGLISDIDVRITSFGTLASYGHLQSKKKNVLTVYLREDFGLAQLAEVIVSTLVYEKYGYSVSEWEASESITDFIMKVTALADIFEGYKPTMENLKINSHEVFESNLYLSEIGIPEEQVLSIRNGMLFFGDKNIEKELTNSQSKLVKLLLNRKGEVVFYDDLAYIIWDQSSVDKYSIWAINKHMQRLRDRLFKVGIAKVQIHGIRGRGYLLS